MFSSDLLLKAQVNYSPLTVFQYQITVVVALVTPEGTKNSKKLMEKKKSGPNELTKSLIN